MTLTICTLILAIAAPPIDEAALRAAPGVASVTVSGPQDAERIIVHVCDWHFVRLDAFAAAARDADGDLPDQKELLSEYGKHLVEVAVVQAQQRKLLEHLTGRYGLRTVFVENWSAKTKVILDAMISQVAKQGKDSHDASEWLTRLKVGAADQLAAEGRLKLRPAEDEAAHTAMGKTAGKWTKEHVHARDQAIVRNVERGNRLLDAHRRVRVASRAKRISHHVPQLPPDVLGIYIMLPVAGENK